LALRAFAGGLIFADVIGSSTPRILALHGWARRGNDFAAVLNGLDAMAPDLPGFGASPPPKEVMGAAGYASLLEPLLDEFEEPPVILGHSFGGRVAVCLEAQNPGRVRALILTGVPLIRLNKPVKASLGYRMVKRLHSMGVISDERLEAEKRERGSPDYRASVGVMRDILVKVIQESYEANLANVQVPVHLIWGAADTEVPVSVAEEAMTVISSAGGTVSLTVLEEVGHMTPIEAPEPLRRSILGALTA
jgi:pimeloyl-ACP methyl ester carboxylesterase